LAAQGKGESLLVRPGQTATLIWDKGGIRVILPVTCLEAGARGQVVRVRLKNVVRTLRAEVMEDGTLQVRL
jgi:flagella basal body P-ring formation protein FlgA